MLQVLYIQIYYQPYYTEEMDVVGSSTGQQDMHNVAGNLWEEWYPRRKILTANEINLSLLSFNTPQNLS